LTEGNQKKSE